MRGPVRVTEQAVRIEREGAAVYSTQVLLRQAARGARHATERAAAGSAAPREPCLCAHTPNPPAGARLPVRICTSQQVCTCRARGHACMPTCSCRRPSSAGPPPVLGPGDVYEAIRDWNCRNEEGAQSDTDEEERPDLPDDSISRNLVLNVNSHRNKDGPPGSGSGSGAGAAAE